MVEVEVEKIIDNTDYDTIANLEDQVDDLEHEIAHFKADINAFVNIMQTFQDVAYIADATFTKQGWNEFAQNAYSAALHLKALKQDKENLKADLAEANKKIEAMESDVESYEALVNALGKAAYKGNGLSNNGNNNSGTAVDISGGEFLINEEEVSSDSANTVLDIIYAVSSDWHTIENDLNAVLEEVYDTGYNDGYADGYDDGHADGYNEALSDING